MFTIVDDGIELQAELDMPEKAEGKIPVVVMIHGFTGYKEEWHIVQEFSCICSPPDNS